MASATVPTTVGAVPLESGSNWRMGLLICFGALLLRLIAAALFFGSVDTINLIKNSITLVEGKSVLLPYFPTVNALIWLGGVLAAYTPLPFPLCLKLVPILFDSLIAALVYELVARTVPGLATRAGWLYAVCPVALLINGFHGHWDSIALFFLLLGFAFRSGNGLGGEFLFGLSFSVSLLVKPIALPFLLLVWPRKDAHSKSIWGALAGLSAGFATAFTIFTVAGFSLLDTLIGIVSYSAKGVQVFGLPFAPGLAQVAIQNYRLAWVIPGMIAVAVLYHRGKLTATDSMLLFYLFTLGTSGLSPQYLLWPLPLLLISGRLRLASFYTAVATLFLLLYYMNPWASYFPFENLAIFAPMRGLAWLLPPAAMAARGLLPFVHAMGNFVFPVCALIVAFLLAKRPLPADFEEHWSARWVYMSPAGIIAAAVLVARVVINQQYVRSRISEIWNQLPAQYAMHVQSLNPAPIFVADFGSFGPANVVLLLGLITAAWCLAAFSEG